MVGALGVASLCAAAWSEPDARVIARSDLGSLCPTPRVVQASPADVRPDHDLLLFMYGLSQSLVSRS